MKKQFFAIAAAALVLAAGCSKETGGNDPIDKGTKSGVAYVSVKVAAQNKTRASSEANGSNAENNLDALYLFTFDAVGNVVNLPGENYTITVISPENPYEHSDAIKVSAASEYLVMIANPGEELLAKFATATTYSALNAVITGIDFTEMQNDNGDFTMITSGDETDKEPGDLITNAYVSLAGALQLVDEDTDDAQAQEDAVDEENVLTVKLERLAAKLSVVEKAGGATTKRNANDAFTLTSWTVDALNTTYSPYAEKTVLEVAHTSSLGSYVSNFYTKDPNYLSATASTGIVYNTAPAPSFEPVFIWGEDDFGWKNAGTVLYTVENTMAANAQKIANATRVVLKATYFPENFTAGDDWFSFAGSDYPNLAALQGAYADANAAGDFKAACDRFLARVKELNTDIPAVTAFADLTQGQLDEIQNGGNAVKEGTTPVILWYQDGLCYYYWEIRHDNSTAANAATSPFAKYGVVRNNQYNLTLTSVEGPGTPWYPEIENPGPGDPDPDDDIDTGTGYLGITVTVAPWIVWETNMEI